MTPIWQRNFRTFVGPGLHFPSETMRVGDDEAALVLERLKGGRWSAPVVSGHGRHAGYSIRHADSGWNTALFADDTPVGFYADSYLWIAPPHRGKGLSTPLIVAAAEQRGGCVMPPGVAFQGYTRRGLAAHRSAHAQAVLTALAEGLSVPQAVLDELAQAGETMRTVQPSTCS